MRWGRKAAPKPLPSMGGLFLFDFAIVNVESIFIFNSEREECVKEYIYWQFAQ